MELCPYINILNLFMDGICLLFSTCTALMAGRWRAKILSPTAHVGFNTASCDNWTFQFLRLFPIRFYPFGRKLIYVYVVYDMGYIRVFDMSCRQVFDRFLARRHTQVWYPAILEFWELVPTAAMTMVFCVEFGFVQNPNNGNQHC